MGLHEYAPNFAAGSESNSLGRGAALALLLVDAPWKKSPQSQTSNCVEAVHLTKRADIPEAVAVRDSKDPLGAALSFEPEAWRAFTGGVSGLVGNEVVRPDL